MVVSRQDIAERLKRLADAEIIELLQSGDPTELGREAAVAELGRRGVEPGFNVAPKPEPDAPILAPIAATPVRNTWRKLGRAAWRAYLGIVVAAWVVQVGLMARQGAYTRQPTWPVNCSFGVVDALSVLGLYGYIRPAKLLGQGFWQVVVTVYLGKLAIGAGFLVYNLTTMPQLYRLYPWRSSNEFRAAVAGLAGFPFALPQIWALCRYAFGYAALWRRPVPA